MATDGGGMYVSADQGVTSSSGRKASAGRVRVYAAREGDALFLDEKH